MNDPKQPHETGAANTIVGFVSYALLLLGGASFFAAFLAVVNNQDYIGAGICGVSSALSFGFLLHAISRR